MIIIEEWIQRPLSERIAHIKEHEECIERGGNSTSHRGILAQYLNTNIPAKVDLCHFCGNGKCSNPSHLYWGTRAENINDSKRHGTWTSAWEKTVEKYGYEQAVRLNTHIGNKNGTGNKGKSKSEEHKKKISMNRRGGKPKGWKKCESGEIGETQQIQNLPHGHTVGSNPTSRTS